MILSIRISKVFVKRHGKKNPSYWKTYRQKNPQKAERNRILQMIRNEKRVHREPEIENSPGIPIKMDSSDREQIKLVITLPKIGD